MKKILSMIIVSAMLFALLAGCGAEPEQESEGLSVGATVFAPYDFARQLVGERGEVTLLLPPGSCPLPRGGLRALRTAYCDELAAAAAYKSAAEREKSKALSGLYLSNASDEERHAGILKELILSAL